MTEITDNHEEFPQSSANQEDDLGKVERIQRPSLLKNRDFMAILTGGFVSNTGTYFSFIALIFLSIKLTTDQGLGKVQVAQAITLITIFQIIPSVIGGPIGGVIVDRVSRKKILIVADLLGVLVSLSLTLVTTMNQIYLVAVIFATIRVFLQPALSASIPLLVDQEQLLQGNSLIQIVFQLTRIIGPALAGVIIAFYSYDLAFIIDAGTFFVSALFMMSIKTNLNVENPDKLGFKQVVTDFKEGFNLSFRDLVMGFFAIALSAAFLVIGLIDPLFVIYLSQDFGLGEEVFGYILSLSAVTGLIGAIVVLTKGDIKKKATLTISSFIILGVSMLLLAVASFTDEIMLLYIGMALVGLFGVVFNIPLSTLVQSITKNEHLGKITGFIGTLMLVAQLSGALLALFLISYLDIKTIYLGAGLLAVLMTFVFLGLLNKLDLENIIQQREGAMKSVEDSEELENKDEINNSKNKTVEEINMVIAPMLEVSNTSLEGDL